MSKFDLIGLSGSLRADSCNRKLIREAARLFDAKNYVEADIKFPVYDGDDEAESGAPEAVKLLSRQIAEADAVVISTPEYNKGPSGVLKNALDWISRVKPHPWQGKPVAVMSASSGRSGGERSQLILRTFMVTFRPKIIQGPEMHLADCNNQFDENGHLKSELYLETLKDLMENLRAEVER